MYSLEINGKVINFEIRKNKNLKNTYISIDKYGKVLVKARSISRQTAFQIVNHQSDWIIKTLDKIYANPPAPKEKPSLKDEMPFLGVMYPVEYEDDYYTKKVRIFFSDNKFTVCFSPFLTEEERLLYVPAYFDEFYRYHSEQIVPPRVYYWADIMNVEPKDINFRKTKRRWGSCSHDNKISFSLSLSKLNQDDFDYIIIHELSHIIEKNHSKNFWNLVEKYMPDYKERHKSILSRNLF
ncbi:MAG: M48 family metallopeptidase [Candidatus Sericytochromatia bacterium]